MRMTDPNKCHTKNKRQWSHIAGWEDRLDVRKNVITRKAV